MPIENRNSAILPETIVEYSGKKYAYTWIAETDYRKMGPYNLVSVVCFNQDGQVLLSCQNDIWRLPGGGPELRDITPAQTAAREFLEETNIELKNTAIIGGFRVTALSQARRKAFFQLAIYAEVSIVHPRTPDPEEGIIFPYEFFPIERVNQQINWKETGDAMLAVAKTRWALHHLPKGL